MTDNEKKRFYATSVRLSREGIEQVNELEQVLNESRSRVIARAISYLHHRVINLKKKDYKIL